MDLITQGLCTECDEQRMMTEPGRQALEGFLLLFPLSLLKGSFTVFSFLSCLWNRAKSCLLIQILSRCHSVTDILFSPQRFTVEWAMRKSGAMILTALLRYNSHIIEFSQNEHHSMFFIIFTGLVNHRHNLILKHFALQKEIGFDAS